MRAVQRILPYTKQLVLYDSAIYQAAGAVCAV